MKSLEKYTSNLKDSGHKTLVAYLTAGLPGWIEAIHVAHESGADIVEVGLPFSDPVMDGPVIARASQVALSAGVTTLELLDILSQETFSKPIVVMTYTNVLFVHGVKEIVQRLSKSNCSGLILPDLTFEQSWLFSNELKDSDISLIQLVSSTTSDERMKDICQASEGFLYCIAIKGITGDNVNTADKFTEFIPKVREISKVPTYCGVGVRTPDDASELSRLSDGVIVGTTFVQYMLDNPGDNNGLGELIRSFCWRSDLPKGTNG